MTAQTSYTAETIDSEYKLQQIQVTVVAADTTIAKTGYDNDSNGYK